MLKETYDYTYLKKHNPIRKNDVNILYDGTFLPISTASYLTGWSKQMIRYMFMQDKIRSVKFSVGPILVCLEDLTVEAKSKKRKEGEFIKDIIKNRTEDSEINKAIEKRQIILGKIRNKRGHNKFKI